MIGSVYEGAVARITLDGAQMTSSAGAALLAAIRKAHEEPTVRSILIEASGPVFCAGGDCDIPAGVFEFRHWMTKPVVCGVQGTVLGPGVAIVANAHVVVAAQGTSFGLTEVRAGQWPIGLQAISLAIGQRRAVELALTGRVFSAPEALQMGLVHELAPAFEFEDRASAHANHLANLKLDGRLPVL